MSLPRAASSPSSALAALLGDPTGGAATPSTVLMVCTGNICRSPLAEVLLRARLGDADVHVRSAGTHALVGQGMTPPASLIAVREGADPADAEGHAATYLTERHLTPADLVLAMTADHRAHVIRMVPSRRPRTFTVREFARLASDLSDEELATAAGSATTAGRARVDAVVRAVHQRRRPGHLLTDDDDVIDPYRRSEATYEASAAQLLPALHQVERVLRIALG